MESSSSSVSTIPQPRSVCERDGRSLSLLRAIFFLLGIGTLVPWSLFTAAKAYFETRFSCSDENASVRSSRWLYLHNRNENDLESTLAIAYNLSAISCLGFLILLQWIQKNVFLCMGRHEKAAQPVSLAITTEEQQRQLPANRDEDDRDGLLLRVEQTPSSQLQDPRPQSAGSTATTTSLPIHETSLNPTIPEESQVSAGGEMALIPFWTVIGAFSVTFLVCFSQAVAVFWIHLDPHFLRYWTILDMMLCGICGALCSTGILTLAGLFRANPKIAMQPFQAGQSMGGLLVSLANVVATMNEDPQLFWNLHCSNHSQIDFLATLHEGYAVTMEHRSGMESTSFLESSGMLPASECSSYSRIDVAVFLYFLLGSLVLASCIAGFMYVAHYHTMLLPSDDYERLHDMDTNAASGAPLEQSYFLDTSTDPESSPPGFEINAATLLQRHEPDCIDSDDSDRQQGPAGSMADNGDLPDTNISMSLGDDARIMEEHHCETETIHVWSIVRGPAVSVSLILFVTLALFPGWISQLKSVHQCSNIRNRWTNDLYTPTAFVIFNAAELTGRILGGYFPLSQMDHATEKLIVASFLRFLFFPLFYLCSSIHDGNHKRTIPSDFYSLLLQILFAATNGYLLAAVFVHTPTLLPNVVHIQERSAKILTFWLYLGLLCGSFFSVPLSQILAG